MALYSIIGIVKEDMPSSNMTRLAVAYRNNKSGDEQYFICHVNKFYEQDHIDLLLKYSYDAGGAELTHAVNKYIHLAKNPWGTSMKVETVNVADFDKTNWFATDPDALISPMKITSKQKITIESDVSYNNGGYIGDFGPYKGGGGAPPGVNQLPGLAAIVNHPGDPSEVAIACGHRATSSVKAMVIHLNDNHKWTREQIADWLDEISDPTGETGPDLRFGSQPAKVEPESKNPCEEVIPEYTSNHKHHVHVGFDQLKQMHMHIDLPSINEDFLKLMTGEANEQD